MIVVTDLSRTRTEPIFDISEDFVMNQTVTGELDLSFTCFPTDRNPGYDLLTVEATVQVDGLEFRVKNFASDGFYKKIYATSLFYENTKTRVPTIYEGDNTLVSQLDFVLAQSGWSYNIDNNIRTSVRNIVNLGRDNIVALLKIIVAQHNIEFQILPNRRINFSRQIGPVTDFQYRYKHNLESVVRTEDTTNLYTRITGYGADGVTSVYTSPLVFAFGILDAPDYVNNAITDPAVLNNYLSTLIKDVPDLSIDSKIPALTEREIGSSIWLIYEPLNIRMRTRILRQSKSFVNRKLVTTEINVGNTLNKNIIDILVDQQARQNEINQQLQNEYVTDESLELQIQALNMRLQEGLDFLSSEISGFDGRIDDVRTELNNNVIALNLGLNEKASRDRLVQDINAQITTEKINTSKLDLSGNT